MVGKTSDAIPIIVCPTDGETSSNFDPVDEARKKILNILPHFSGKDVVIFAADSVQDIETAVDEQGNRTKLGKPANTELAKRVRERALGQPLGNDDIEETIGDYYLQKYYLRDQLHKRATDNPLIDRHETGIVAWRSGVEVTDTLLLELPVTMALLEKVTPSMHAGGGGVFQQLVHLAAENNPDIWLQLDPSGRLNAYLQTVESELWPAVVFFHIMGNPCWILPALFEKLSDEIGLDILRMIAIAG